MNLSANSQIRLFADKILLDLAQNYLQTVEKSTLQIKYPWI